jgi:hypothetical protein
MVSSACSSTASIAVEDAGMPGGGGDGGGSGAGEAREASEFGSAAGRVIGPTYQLDFQLGHPASDRRSSSPTYELKGAAAVEP